MNILIVKLSSLGDVVHAMPAVQDIRRQFPDAQIDWVVERGFAPLVTRCQGVRRVIPCELRRWRKTPFGAATRQAWAAFKSDLQSQRYDAVIDLQGLSKSALVSWLARLTPNGQRYGLANRTEGSSFEAPARWVAHRAIVVPAHSHAVTRSRIVCAQALGYALPQTLQQGLVAQPLAPMVQPDVSRWIALVHGTSRRDKEWPLANWRALALRLNAAGLGVVLPHGSDTEESVAKAIAQDLPYAKVWPRLTLDRLTDALGGCAGVIGVDSGLSHVAVALDLPHVQIYNFDTAWRTGPLPEARRQCSVFAQPTPTVDAVWQAWLDMQAAA